MVDNYYFMRKGMKCMIEPILDLEMCVEESDIDLYFETIHNPANLSIPNRNQFLLDYMGVEGTSFYGDLTDEQQYKLTKEVYIARIWKTLKSQGI